MRTLADMRPGDRAVIKSLRCPDPRRLADMGFVPGEEVEFLRTAPLGDPILLRVRGCRVALRRREGMGVEIV